MKNNKLISVKELGLNYGIKPETIYCTYHYRKPHWLTKVDGETKVNITYLLRVKAFRKKMYDEAQELYYKHQNNNSLELARYMNTRSKHSITSYNNFLYCRLFKSNEQSIANTTIPAMLVKMVRILRRKK